LRAPITLVVMPEECQSMPMTAPKGLEPEGVRQAPQQLVSAVMVHNGLGDHAA
jgi:hypothetical protein